MCDKRNKNYTVDDIVTKFNEQASEQSLFSFIQGVIGQLKRLNRIRTAETYTAALSSFMKFRDGQDILLCEIDGDTMMLYEAWLKAKGICPNTVSFYMRILRAVYNRAVEKELVEQKHPFKHVYTGIHPWHVIHRYGLSQKIRFEKWYYHLSEKEDQPTA